MIKLFSRAGTLAFASVAILALSGCRRAGAPPAEHVHPGGDVTGTWLHREMPVRYMEAMALRVRGDSVLGEGTYSMEAGRTGNSTIVGKWHHSGRVTLDILRDTGVREQWAGTLHGDSLTGTLKIADAEPQPFAYVRQP